MLIAKSRQYINIVATTILVILAPWDCRSTPNIDRNPPTISCTQDRASKEMISATAPPTINGFLLPHGCRQLSLRIPMYGCTRVPVTGPAIHTNARRALLMPRESRYGYKVISKLVGRVPYPQRTREFNDPMERPERTDPLDNSTDQTTCNLSHNYSQTPLKHHLTIPKTTRANHSTG